MYQPLTLSYTCSVMDIVTCHHLECGLLKYRAVIGQVRADHQGSPDPSGVKAGYVIYTTSQHGIGLIMGVSHGPLVVSLALDQRVTRLANGHQAVM